MNNPQRSHMINLIRPYLFGEQFTVTQEEVRMYGGNAAALFGLKKREALRHISDRVAGLLAWDVRPELGTNTSVHTTRVFIIPEHEMRLIVQRLFGEE